MITDWQSLTVAKRQKGWRRLLRRLLTIVQRQSQSPA
jgi:hypothetical protein